MQCAGTAPSLLARAIRNANISLFRTARGKRRAHLQAVFLDTPREMSSRCRPAPLVFRSAAQPSIAMWVGVFSFSARVPPSRRLRRAPIATTGALAVCQLSWAQRMLSAELRYTTRFDRGYGGCVCRVTAADGVNQAFCPGTLSDLVNPLMGMRWAGMTRRGAARWTWRQPGTSAWDRHARF
jgi:hypothetical protein